MAKSSATNFFQFFATTMLFTLGCTDGEFKLEVETITSTELTKTFVNDFDSHPMVKMSDEDRRNLCIAAKKHISFDEMDAEITSNSYEPKTYRITYPDGGTTDTVAMRCWTIPKLHLRIGNSDTDVKILLRTNEFADENTYSFRVEVVQIHPEVYMNRIPPAFWDTATYATLWHPLHRLFLEDSWDQKLRENRLTKLLDHERLYICFTAKKAARIAQGVLPVLHDSVVGVPKVYVIVYPDRTEIQIASLCPSYPPLYVFFGESDYDVHAVLVRTPEELRAIQQMLYSMTSVHKLFETDYHNFLQQ